MATLGREIKKARASLGWKQQDLRDKTGISQKYLSRIENDHVDPSWSMVVKIATALGMDLNVFCRQEMDEPESDEAPSAPASRQRKAKPKAKE